MSLSLKHISLPLAHFTLEVNVEIRSRVTAVFGPSGSGKTSLLELVAGLRRTKTALIQLDDAILTDTTRGVFVPVRQRRIGYVPQDLALFPHLSVRQNLLYGHRPGGDARFSFDHIVGLLEIGPLVRRGVAGLSGGEKQRVALARALLASPRLLLLDEPLASLDAPLKAKILPYLIRIRDEFHIPMLHVTHDRFEALALGDDLLAMENGRIVQHGPAHEVFSRPANLAVAGIVAVETIRPARVVNATDGLVTVAIGGTKLTALERDLPSGTSDVYVCIRAEDVIVTGGGDAHSSPRNRLGATVRGMAREGPMVRIDLDCGFPLMALLTKQACEELALKVNDRVFALVKAPNVHLIPRSA